MRRLTPLVVSLVEPLQVPMCLPDLFPAGIRAVYGETGYTVDFCGFGEFLGSSCGTKISCCITLETGLPLLLLRRRALGISFLFKKTLLGHVGWKDSRCKCRRAWIHQVCEVCQFAGCTMSQSSTRKCKTQSHTSVTHEAPKVFRSLEVIQQRHGRRFRPDVGLPGKMCQGLEF